MSEHQLLAYIYDADAERLRSELGAEFTDQMEDTGCSIASTTSPRVGVLHVWFPDSVVYAALDRIGATKSMWIDEYFSKGVDWDRRRLCLNGALVYDEGVSIDGELYVSFGGETRSCQPERPTAGLVEWADRARTHFEQELGEARIILPVRFGAHVVLEGDAEHVAPHPIEKLLNPAVGISLPEATRLDLGDDDIPF